MKTNQIALILVIIILSGTTKIIAAEIGVNLYGLSLHSERNDTIQVETNGLNLGCGIRLEFQPSLKHIIFIEGGGYDDSFHNSAIYSSIGYLHELYGRFSIGFQSAVYVTESTNKGDPFIALVPLINYKLKKTYLNIVYLPRFKNTNPYHILGIYLTIIL